MKAKQHKKKTAEVDRTRQIVAVVPEYCAGPGWSNIVIWIYWIDGDKRLHRDALQRDDFSRDVSVLLHVADAAHRSLLAAVRAGGAFEERP